MLFTIGQLYICRKAGIFTWIIKGKIQILAYGTPNEFSSTCIKAFENKYVDR